MKLAVGWFGGWFPQHAERRPGILLYAFLASQDAVEVMFVSDDTYGDDKEDEEDDEDEEDKIVQEDDAVKIVKEVK